jgi:hypothetical protein
MAPVEMNATMEVLRSIYGVTYPSETLRRALDEGSNLVMDWMWYAEQMESDAERRYCLERALYINPDYTHALTALEMLDDKRATQEMRRPRFSVSRLLQAWFRTPLFAAPNSKI